jgi:hypothetical protein
MTPIAFEVRGFSRTKALIGALLACVALAGVVQVAAPAHALAQKSREAEFCDEIDEAISYWQAANNPTKADYYQNIWNEALCGIYTD